MSNPAVSSQTTLLPEHESLVENFVSCGRYDGPHAVLTAALKLLQDKERERTARLSALHAVLAAELPTIHGPVDADDASVEIERLLAIGLVRQDVVITR